MKKYIIGNWKSNKTVEEAKQWLDKFNSQLQTTNYNLQAKIIICPAFTHLSLFREYIDAKKLPIELGAQDVSAYDSGAYTGQVSAAMLQGLVDWVIIGHSERRKYFGETDEVLSQKVVQAQKAGLNVIFCVSDEKTAIPDGVAAVAYEPVWAIGSGKTDTPENANAVCGEIKQKTHVATVIYGGSVKPENVASFLSQKQIDGVLPGGASLQANSFFNLITHADTNA